MTKKTIKFKIVTPEDIVLETKVTQVTIPTQSGEITVLPGHIPLVSNLQPGVIEATKEDKTSVIMSVSGGFLEVNNKNINILADTAERAQEIDLAKVEEAKKQAEISKKDTKQFDKIRFANITAKLAKELARERAANKWKKINRA